MSLFGFCVFWCWNGDNASNYLSLAFIAQIISLARLDYWIFKRSKKGLKNGRVLKSIPFLLERPMYAMQIFAFENMSVFA